MPLERMRHEAVPLDLAQRTGIGRRLDQQHHIERNQRVGREVEIAFQLTEPACVGDPLPIGLVKVRASGGRHDAVAEAVELPYPAIPFGGPAAMKQHIRKTNNSLPVLELVPGSVDVGIAHCQQRAHCAGCQSVLR